MRYIKDDFVEAMAKHLPPSASTLNLLDVGGVSDSVLHRLREDIKVEIASQISDHWEYDNSSVDAVIAYDMLLKPKLLQEVLRVMRAGGRFIVTQPYGKPDSEWVETLENAGYVRILVEPAIDTKGVLIRGEKAHTTEDTLERVQGVAQADADLLNLNTYKGRYVHLLIQQTPNKPVWRLAPDEQIQWHAVTATRDDNRYLLAFSSLPKAVAFMQPAVVAGLVKDVNKVGKFSKVTAADWTLPVLLNPTLDSVQDAQINLIEVDPNTAEAPDE